LSNLSRTLAAVAAGACLALGVGGGTVAAQAAGVPTWLRQGPVTVYPSAGGTWQYGFWNAQVRSYYWVGRCHGTTVVYNGETIRSIDTAPDAMSDASHWAYQSSGASDAYYYRVC
jgi:hypothetical protein